MSGKWGFHSPVLLTLVLLLSKPAMGASAFDFEKSYGGPYAGPTLPPEVVVPASPDKPTVTEALKIWHAEALRESFTGFKQQLSRLDPKSYSEFLVGRKALAVACAEKLAPELASLLATFLAAVEPSAQSEAASALAKAAQGKSREVINCLEAAAVRLDGKGVFVSGLLPKQGKAGDDPLSVFKVGGDVFLVGPQLVKAWPGRVDSTLRVLDPRDGPWKVVAAYTASGKVYPHGDLEGVWGELDIDEYSRLHRDGALLLADNSGALLGWLDLDTATYLSEHPKFVTADETVARFKKSFSNGTVAFLHGLWWNPEGHWTGQRARTGDKVQDRVFLYDFTLMIQAETPVLGRDIPYSDPYPRKLELFKVLSFWPRREDDKYLSDSKIVIITRRSREDTYGTYDEHPPTGVDYDPKPGAKGYDRSALRMSSRKKTTIEKLYKLKAKKGTERR